MTETHRAGLVVMALTGILGVLLLAPASAGADTQPSNALVTITQISPSNAVVNSGGNILYSITGKNDGSVRSCPVPPSGCSDRPTLEAEIPAGATFVSCRTTATFVTDPPAVLCAVSGAIVTAQFQTVPAHESVTMRLTIKAPQVTAPTTISLRGKFSGESMHMDERSLVTTVLAPSISVMLSPTRTVLIACGYTLDNAFFGADTEATLLDPMVCNNGSGLTITASGKTFNLGVKTISSSVRVTGNAGIIVGPNATNVTIKGGGTGGTRGIDQFEYCVKDLGGNTGLTVTDLRCFRPKRAGILTLSNEVLINNSKIDRSTADTFMEVPKEEGGIGIMAGGDNVRVKDTIVVGSEQIGFWAYGVDLDGSGRVATYEGNTTSSQITNNHGIGALLSGGPHQIKDTRVQGDRDEDLPLVGTSVEGIVVEGTALGTVIDGVKVEKHRGNAIHVEAGATGTVIARTTVENMAGSGFVMDAPSTLSGNTAQLIVGDGFVINASATMTSNKVEECTGNAFVINAAAIVDSNSAVNNGGYGFVLTNLSFPNLGIDWSVQGVGDFNGDGKADILWRHTSGAVVIWLLNGTSVVGTGSLGVVPTDWTVQGIADFNGDGKADILWRHTSGLVYTWFMNGTSKIGEGQAGGVTVPTDWSIVGVGDYNGDGKADILWRHTSGLVYLWLMNGTSKIGEGQAGVTVTTDWSIVGVGDYNGDGKADILWRHNSGFAYLWLMNGMSKIGEGPVGVVTMDWSIVGGGDYNGDGKADILWRHSSGFVYLWLMNGTSKIGEGPVGGTPTDWTIVGGGDFNGDGKADILWRDSAGGISTWLMNGTNLLATSGPARLRSNSSDGNDHGGFLVSGSGNTLDGNTAKNSGGPACSAPSICGRGFDLTGSGNVLNTNRAEDNADREFVIGPNNIDDQNNSANGTKFSFSAAGGTFE